MATEGINATPVNNDPSTSTIEGRWRNARVTMMTTETNTNRVVRGASRSPASSRLAETTKPPATWAGGDTVRAMASSAATLSTVIRPSHVAPPMACSTIRVRPYVPSRSRKV
jgi:hypothetical protein